MISQYLGYGCLVILTVFAIVEYINTKTERYRVVQSLVLKKKNRYQYCPHYNRNGYYKNGHREWCRH